MTIQKLQAVMWRLRTYAKKRKDETKRIPYVLLHRAIDYECGTSSATYKNNMAALRRLGWIIKADKGACYLTDKDLTEG